MRYDAGLASGWIVDLESVAIQLLLRFNVGFDAQQ